jgi:hypothetical protein
MFKVVQGRRAWWPVVFNGVTEEGKVVENKIELRFHIHGEDEYSEVMFQLSRLQSRAEELARMEIDGPAAAEGDEAGADADDVDADARRVVERKILGRLYAEFVERIAIDWRGIGFENGVAMKFEKDNLEAALVTPNLFAAIVGAYQKCRRGERDVRQGN